jgi:hypothetical protein
MDQGRVRKRALVNTVNFQFLKMPTKRQLASQGGFYFTEARKDDN